MTEIEYRIADLINFSSNQKPIDFENTFKNIMTARVGDSIQDRKINIAKSMFTPSIPDTEEL